MDPNATLTDIRNLLANIESNQLNTVALLQEMHSLAEQVTALDEWLSKGGFLPEDWAVHQG